MTDASMARRRAGAPADPGRRAPVERKDQVASNHAGRRVPDKTPRLGTWQIRGLLGIALLVFLILAVIGRS